MSRKFILIDHSLQDLGGHHFPYAFSVLHAAQCAGWDPELVTHRRFADRAALPADWPVHALFRHRSYSRFTLDIQAHRPAGAFQPLARAWRRWATWRAARARRALARAFAADCATLFSRTRIGPLDIVFVGTTSELDLLGLGLFLNANPAASAQWHLQFHFGLFHGREPDYPAQQTALSTLQSVFREALADAGKQRLHFYCTTEALCEQYQRLGVAPFVPLSYPVHPFFQPQPPPAAALRAPLRIACLGHARREKGYGQLPQLLRELWAAWFGPGRARLVLQTHRGGQRRALERLITTLQAGTPGAPPMAALEFAPFPLPLAAYAQLLCGVDIGLLLYDATSYYARCSGVLLEMQCAGVPVLVPAGGWLAEQIEPHNQRYLDGLAARAVASCALPADGRLEPAPTARSLLLEFTWLEPAPPGQYLRVSVTHPDRPASIAILGPRGAGQPVRCLFAVPSGADLLKVTLHNAWQRAPAPVRAARLAWLDDVLPAGALGLSIAEDSQVPRLLAEVLEHHAHYRAQALLQAPDCAQQHSAARVIATLSATRQRSDS